MSQFSVPGFYGTPLCDRRNDDDNNNDDHPLTPPMPEAGKLWIHCNDCFAQYAVMKMVTNKKDDGGGDTNPSEDAFFLLACRHVSCYKCAIKRWGTTPSDAPHFVCRICRRTVRGRQLNNSLPSNLKTFFHPEPWSLCSDGINSFQQKNMKHFNKHKERIETEFIKEENERDFARKICQSHCLKNRLLVAERRKVWQRLQQLKIECRIRQEQQRARRCKSKSPSQMREKSPSRIDVNRGAGSRKRSHSSPKNRDKGTVFFSLAPQSKEARRHTITSFSSPSNISFDL